MPNPTAPIVDDFNRTDTDSITDDARWTKDPARNRSGSIFNNALTDLLTPDWFTVGSFYNMTAFSGNVEVAMTRTDLVDEIAEPDGWDVWTGLYAKMSELSSTGTSDGYAVRLNMNGASTSYTWQLYRVDNGVFTAIGSSASRTFPRLHELFLEAKNDASGTLTVYDNGTQVIQTTDSTYKAQSGYTGFRFLHQAPWRASPTPRWGTPYFDNFKAGNPIVAGENRRRHPMRPRMFRP